MRENKNQIRKSKRIVDDKILKYSAIGLTILAVVVFAFFIYSKNVSDKMQEDLLSSEEFASIMNDSNDFENLGDTEKVSSSIGKTVEESQNNTISNNTSSTNDASPTNKPIVNTTAKTSQSNSANKTSSTSENQKSKETNQQNNGDEEKSEKEVNTNTARELKFEKPVEGEIVRDYSKDSLVYSETLKEWVTHLGIDIKADKATVVKAAEAGKIKTIKNDPRFGITVVIEHDNGFQTVYSNLLTSEFVVEGENVEKGQSIGTVGNTAIFEIADEPHLHFEILKDSIQVDPNLYLK